MFACSGVGEGGRGLEPAFSDPDQQAGMLQQAPKSLLNCPSSQPHPPRSSRAVREGGRGSNSTDFLATLNGKSGGGATESPQVMDPPNWYWREPSWAHEARGSSLPPPPHLGLDNVSIELPAALNGHT